MKSMSKNQCPMSILAVLPWCIEYKKVVTVIIAYLSGCICLSAQNSFDLALIPEAVKKNSDVIKRFEKIEFEVKDIDRATLKVHRVLTVLNENGKDELFFNLFANKFILFEDADIKLYDGSGKLIEKYKKKDLNTRATGEGLVDDGKMIYLMAPASSYPVTIEYKYEQVYKGTLFYPSYEILTPGMGVESSTFITKVPKDLDVRYKEKNIQLKPVITEEGNFKIYQWTVNNLPSIEYEEGSVSYESRYPSILLAPNHFKLDDYEGDMTTWEQFGMWYNQLKKGNDVLTEDRKIFLRNLVKDAGSETEKIRLIYKYLQNNFRYVSIQLGAIGGYRPIAASFTDEKKYGDCKALSNYMQASLDAVGIKSYQALINAEYNKEPVDPAFPCNLFNHVILCVPQKQDTIWLECTSKTNNFGMLGTFTENRNALLITEKGGVLVSTPRSKSSENIFNANTSITLTSEGGGNSQTNIKATGEYKEDMINYLFEEKSDDQKQFLVNRLGFKQPDFFKIAKKDSGNSFSTLLEMEIEKIPELKTNNKMFLTPRLYRLSPMKLPKSENRKQDFYFRSPFEKTDTTIYKLPEEFQVEALPSPKKLEGEYTTYQTNYWYDEKGRSIYSTAKLVLRQLKIPASQYASVKKFFDDVLLDDSQRIVIRKQ